MTKRFLLVAVLACALLGSVAIANAGSGRFPVKHKVSETLKIRVLTSNDSGARFTGTIQDKAQGEGAVVIDAAGGADATTNTIKAVGFFRLGTLLVKGSVTTTPRADGSGFDYAGTAKITGGTGKFKGATGKLTLKGSATAADPAYQEYSVTGSAVY
jgi:hypothetical protein